MKKVAKFLKVSEATIDVSIDKYLEPYREKIKNTEKKVEDLKKEIEVYDEHLKKQMQKLVDGMKSVKLNQVFITGGFGKVPVGHFSIRSPQMDKKELENEIKELGFKGKVEEEQHIDTLWFMVSIELESFESLIKRWKSSTALDFLFRKEL